ncbi:MarR family transcriptional regulator [bacterium]|nr:MarR family transcriptional regulator [bacterium]
MQDLALIASELQLLNSRLRRRLREQATAGDFTPSQINVLLYLEREVTATVTDLAQAEGVRTQSMGATVAALLAAGMVQGRPDPDDRRRTLLSLTDACRSKLEHGRVVRQHWLVRAIHSQLSQSEQDQLAAAVQLLKRLVEYEA